MSIGDTGPDKYTRLLVEALKPGEIDPSDKLQLIDEIATSLWGKDFRDAYQISRSICLPIFLFIEKHLKGKIQNE